MPHEALGPLPLASGALNRAGKRLSIELHQPADSPSFVMVVWPGDACVTAPTQSISGVGVGDGPHVGGGAVGTCREGRNGR